MSATKAFQLFAYQPHIWILDLIFYHDIPASTDDNDDDDVDVVQNDVNALTIEWKNSYTLSSESDLNMFLSFWFLILYDFFLFAVTNSKSKPKEDDEKMKRKEISYAPHD